MSQVEASSEKNPSSQQVSCASLVIEHRVAKGKEEEFKQWQTSLDSAVIQFEGYLRTDLSYPVIGAQEKWYVIVYFDTPDHLNQWVNSSERQALVKQGEKLFGSYKFRSFKTGLESWFTDETPIPAWKQNLIVFLGLYPTVMLQTLLFSSLHLLESWPLSVAMFINNFICCSLLTWVVVPPLSRWFNDWLIESSPNPFLPITKGLTVVMGSLILLVILFYTFSDSDPLTVYRTLEKMPKSLFS